MFKASKRWDLIFGMVAVSVTLTSLTIAKDPPKPDNDKPKPFVRSQSDQLKVLNEQIEAQWKANSLRPSEQCTDYEFVRRIHLDLIGRIARPDEVRSFIHDTRGDKRTRLIDKLLQSPEYAENWGNIWTTWLMTRSGPKLYHDQMALWMEDHFAKSTPWDKVVSQLLTASGDNNDNGAVNFILSHLGEATPRGREQEEGRFDFTPITARVSRLFLGLQIQCVQCHDDQLNSRWKQKDFWGMNAFFRQVERVGQPLRMRNAPPVKLGLRDDTKTNVDRDGEEKVAYETRRAMVQYTRAVFLDGQKRLDRSVKSSRREQLAKFIVEDPYFGKAYVNRIWGHFMGRGFTNPGPVDDFGDHNPLTHELPDDVGSALKGRYGSTPTLLDYLANEFVQSGHDTRQVVRWICNSRAYNLSCVANRSNEKTETDPFFSRKLLKSMSPEQMFESLMVATNAQSNAKETKDQRKQRKERWLTNLVVKFGDDEGNEATFNGSVVQALMMMNGKDISDAITSNEGTVAQAMKKGNNKQIVEELYMAALNRHPTAKEVDQLTKVAAMKVKERKPENIWQDLFWALLNCNEFMLVH